MDPIRRMPVRWASVRASFGICRNRCRNYTNRCRNRCRNCCEFGETVNFIVCRNRFISQSKLSPRFLQIHNNFYNGFYNDSYSDYTVSTQPGDAGAPTLTNTQPPVISRSSSRTRQSAGRCSRRCFQEVLREVLREVLWGGASGRFCRGRSRAIWCASPVPIQSLFNPYSGPFFSATQQP